MKKFLAFLFIMSFGLVFSQDYCPAWKWAKPMQAEPTSATTDGSGNCYVAGYLNANTTAHFGSTSLQTIPFVYSSYVAKIDSNGIWQWAKKIDNVYIRSIAMGQNNNLLIGGQLTDTAHLAGDTLFPLDTFITIYSGVLALLDTNGNFLWAKALPGAEIYDVALDHMGNAYVTGDFRVDLAVDGISISKLPNSLREGFVAKFDSSGFGEWGRHSGNSGKEIATSPDGISWVAGTYNNATTNFGNYTLNYSGSNTLEPYLALIDEQGNWQWAQVPDSTHLGGNLAYDHSGSCLMGGRHSLSKIDSNGQVLWSASILNAGPASSLGPIGVIPDSSGNAYFARAYLGYHNTSPIYESDTIRPVGYNDLTLAKASASGQWDWAGGAKAGNDNYPSALAFYNSKNIFVGGSYYNGEVVLGLDTLKNNSSRAGLYYIANFSERRLIELAVRDGDSIICGDSIRLTTATNSTAQLTYNWSPGIWLDDSTSANPMASPPVSTTFKVVASRANACKDSNQVTINVEPKIPGAHQLVFETSPGGFKLCSDSISLSAPLGHTHYSWETGDTTRSIEVFEPGVYSVVVTNPHGCLLEDSVEIKPISHISPASDLYLCPNIEDDSVNLFNAEAVDSLIWSTGSSQNNIWVHAPGLYWLEVWKDSCYYVDTVEVSVFTDTANADFTYQVNGNTVSFSPVSSGIVSAQWYFGDGYNDIVPNPTYTYKSNGIYTACLETVDVCGMRDTVCKEINIGSIGVPEVSSITGLKIYPNPVSDVIYLEDPYNSEDYQDEFLIIAANGRVVKKVSSGGEKLKTINVSDLGAGIYLLKYGNSYVRFLKL